MTPRSFSSPAVDKPPHTAFGMSAHSGPVGPAPKIRPAEPIPEASAPGSSSREVHLI